jgi:colicin import membrane protein
MSEFTYNAALGFDRRDTQQWTSLSLAVVVHLVLFAFLGLGVQWQSRQTAAEVVEIWDTTTRQAAPLPEPVIAVEVPKEEPEPEPIKSVPQVEPEDPDIAIEQEKKRLSIEKQKRDDVRKVELAAKKKEQEKIEELKLKKEKLAKEELEKKKLAIEKLAKDKAFQQDMARLNGQVVKTGSGGLGEALKSTGMSRGDPSYNALIAAKVKANTNYLVTDTSSRNPTVEFEINLFPDGSLKGPLKRVKSSGVPAFDEAVEKAIEKSLPFPRNKTGEVPPRLVYVHSMKE